jgi:hypothetical protein
MSPYPSNEKEANFALFVVGAAVTVGPAWAWHPGFGLIAALPWAFVAFWRTSLVEIFFPSELESEEAKLTRAQMQWFQGVGRERRFWKVFDKERKRREERFDTLNAELVDLRRELQAYKDKEEQRIAELEEVLVRPTADRHAQEPKAEKQSGSGED